MTLNPYRRSSLAALAATLATLGAAASAQAATVPARFDPTFGVALAGVGYKGTANFNISDACLSTPVVGSGGFIYSSYDCGAPGSGSGMSLLDAHVDFYDVNDPLQTSIGTVDFGPSSTAVLGMFVRVVGTDQNQVIGVQTALIGASQSSLPSQGDPSFYIQFGVLDPIVGTDEDHLPGAPEAPESPPDLDDFPAEAFQVTTMFKVPQNGDCTTITTGGQQVCASNPAATTFVPEPGSLALALGALAAGCLVRRRRG